MEFDEYEPDTRNGSSSKSKDEKSYRRKEHKDDHIEDEEGRQSQRHRDSRSSREPYWDRRDRDIKKDRGDRRRSSRDGFWDMERERERERRSRSHSMVERDRKKEELRESSTLGGGGGWYRRGGGSGGGGEYRCGGGGGGGTGGYRKMEDSRRVKAKKEAYWDRRDRDIKKDSRDGFWDMDMDMERERERERRRVKAKKEAYKGTIFVYRDYHWYRRDRDIKKESRDRFWDMERERERSSWLLERRVKAMKEAFEGTIYAYPEKNLVDRLSGLPDSVIDALFALVGTKQALQTAALSRAWRYKWTKMTCLSFLSKEFSTLDVFSHFVDYVLSHRDKIDLFSVKLTFSTVVSQEIVDKIIQYAVSHNLQQLNITCLRGDPIEFPPSLLFCQSLTHLTFHGNVYDSNDLCYLISSCDNLKFLILKKCKLMGPMFFINNCRLSSLTLLYKEESCHTPVSVIAPQLKNLKIRNWPGIHLLYTPQLSSLCYIDSGYEEKERINALESDKKASADEVEDDILLIHHTNHLWHLEKVHICIDPPIKKCALKFRKLICMLTSVKFLTLNLELVEFLSSFVEPLPVHLKALKVYPLNEKSKVNDRLQKYMLNLLNGFPGAPLSIDLHKMTIVQNLTQEMEVAIDEWSQFAKAEGTPPLENALENIMECIKKHTPYHVRILNLLLKIINALKRVPTSSHQAKLQKKERVRKLQKATSRINAIVNGLKMKYKAALFVALFPNFFVPEGVATEHTQGRRG